MTLVNIVVDRTARSKPGIRCEPSMPNKTIRPLAIAIRLMMTWMVVNI